MKKFLIIINPVSGKGRGKKLYPDIKKYFVNKSISHDIILTEKPGHAKEIISQNQSNYDVVISVGGDGTLNEIVNGLNLSERITLGVIPIGSGNDFALNLAMSGDLEESLDIITKSAKIKYSDLCQLEYEDVNGNTIQKRFINNFGIGFDAQVAFINQHKKIGKGITSYIIAVLRALFNYNSINYTLSFEDKLIEGDKLLLTFGNGISSGGGFYLTPNAEVDDNLIDITTVDFLKRRNLLRKLPLALFNKLETVEEAKMYKSSSAQVVLDSEVYIHTDGEADHINTKIIKVSILEPKLSFITNV